MGIKRTLTGLAAVAVAAAVLLLSACTPGKPADPVEFTTTWLTAVVGHDKSQSNCDIARGWMTDYMKGFGYKLESCAEVAEIVGLPADTDTSKLGCGRTDRKGRPEDTYVLCNGGQTEVGQIKLFVQLVRTDKGWMVEGVSHG